MKASLERQFERERRMHSQICYLIIDSKLINKSINYPVARSIYPSIRRFRYDRRANKTEGGGEERLVHPNVFNEIVNAEPLIVR